MPVTMGMLPALLKAAADEGNEAFKEGSQASLKKYLQAKEPEVAEQKQEGINKANLKTFNNPDLQKNINEGGSVKVGDLSAGGDPYARNSMLQDRGEEGARQKAIANYNHALPKLQQVFQAAQEGLAAVNDPKNPGSMGQARTLALKAMGMNRYNENEAAAVVPPALRGHISQLFNQAGGDLNPLNDSQRAALNEFFKNQLHTTKQQHDLLKQGSLDTYDSSRYAAPIGHQTLQNKLGGGFSRAIEDADKQYSQVPATQGPNLTAQPNPGPLDKLRAYLGGGQQQPPAPAQAPGAPPVDEAAEFQNFYHNVYKKMKNGPSKPPGQ